MLGIRSKKSLLDEIKLLKEIHSEDGKKIASLSCTHKELELKLEAMTTRISILEKASIKYAKITDSRNKLLDILKSINVAKMKKSEIKKVITDAIKNG